MPNSRIPLADAIDIPAWLEADRQNDWVARVERDREIGNQSTKTHQSEAQRVQRWWAKVQHDQNQLSTGQKLESLFKRVSWIAVVLGLVMGVVLASSILHYDGSHPINVLVLLTVLVVIPLLLFLLSLLIPIFRSSSFINNVNIGSQAFAFLKSKHPVLQEFYSSSRSDQVRDTLLRWKLLLTSQQFGISLSIAALFTLLAKVSFSDLAFGWSTTLNFDSSSLAPWIHALASPWSAWFQDAVPSTQLIEQSRYFRLEDSERALSAQTLTGWWKFIAMCLLVYGIVFRVMAAIFAHLNFSNATQALLMQHSEVNALIDRFNAPDHVRGTAAVVGVDDLSAPSMKYKYETADIVISWNHAKPFNTELSHENIIQVSSDEVINKGSELFGNIETKSIKQIHIFSKSWEPPLLEFHDLISVLRNNFGAEVSISVQPVAANNSEPNQVDVEIWRHSLDKLQDAKVYVI